MERKSVEFIYLELRLCVKWQQKWYYFQISQQYLINKNQGTGDLISQ